MSYVLMYIGDEMAASASSVYLVVSFTFDDVTQTLK